MKRRDFLARVGTGVAAVCSMYSKPQLGAARQGHASRLDKINRVAVSTWSLHKYFESTRGKSPPVPGKMLALLDFPEMIAERYKVHQLEFIAPHFASTEPSYLEELKSRLRKSRSRVVNIPVDIEELHVGGGLSDPDKEVRQSAIEGAKKWIDIAKVVGGRSVRCDPGKMNPQDLTPAVESYKQLAAHGKSKGVRVIIENHGGVGSEHPEELVKLFKQVGSDFLGALPDFGNFPDEPTREKGLTLLFPYAREVCHAKGLEIDPSGNETKFNFPKCVEISKRAGFRGAYSIEYEGPGDPYEGVQKVLDELLRYL